MSFRKILRMMQPPRHMRALDAKSRFQAKASDAAVYTRQNLKCAIVDDEPLALGLLESYVNKTPDVYKRQ